MKGDVELGGENREVTVLFADIRGFTSLTEGREPQGRSLGSSTSMERLSAVVEAKGGVVDKYVGEELMAVFGAPIGPERELGSVVPRSRLVMSRFRGSRRRSVSTSVRLQLT